MKLLPLFAIITAVFKRNHLANAFSCSSLAFRSSRGSGSNGISCTLHAANRVKLTSLNLSSDTSEATPQSKIEGRKNRVVSGYKAMTTAYLTAGLVSAKSSGLSTNLARTLGGYIALPAGLSYILISAAANNRLGSETYKRLNLAMLEYSALGSAVVLLSGGRNKILALAFALSIINCIKGYSYGVLGWDKKKNVSLVGDIVQGTRETIKGFLTMPNNSKAIGYFVATAMIASLKIQKMIEVVSFIQASGFVKELAMPLARFNRLALLTLCLYTLKDAADRDRLGGTTFIELNGLCAISLGIHAAFFTNGGLMTPLGAAGVFFAMFCGYNGMNEKIKRA
ncbi:hypothetical protein ACHAWO_003470 [Cyclotella atomus]|uniref:Uncharacterized protein n=1 Tax=Cyclotella atomus TaxID=382360 RepID=A0ABD3NZX1_9STRA